MRVFLSVPRRVRGGKMCQGHCPAQWCVSVCCVCVHTCAMCVRDRDRERGREKEGERERETK